MGVNACRVEELAGGDAYSSAAIIRAIAESATGPKAETALLNAGAALYVAGKAESIPEGVELAGDAIHDGRVMDLLSRAALATRKNAQT